MTTMTETNRVRRLREALLMRVARCTPNHADAGTIQGGITDLADLADRYREALEEIARRPTVERNPDGDDQAAATMQLIARETLDTSALSRKERP